MRRYVIVILGMIALGASAQTEVTEGHLTATAVDTLHLENGTQRHEGTKFISDLEKQKTFVPLSLSVPYAPREQAHQPLIPTMDMSIPRYQPTTSFELWKGAGIEVNGYQQNMHGMMGISSGDLTIHQDLGRLHFTASGLANKYWMPDINSMMGPLGMPMLHTLWGFGATLSYDISPALSLHAFGTYYATNPIVGAAQSPYINTTKFGGFADIRLNDRFGSYVGAEHYLNPMTGKWDTDPIVTPYINVGRNKKSRIEFPVGSLLKAAFFGNHNDPKRWQAPLPPSH